MKKKDILDKILKARDNELKRVLEEIKEKEEIDFKDLIMKRRITTDEAKTSLVREFKDKWIKIEDEFNDIRVINFRITLISSFVDWCRYLRYEKP